MTNFSYLIRPNRNAPNRQFYGYTSRRGAIQIIVLHTAEASPDYVDADTTAEAVSSYMSNNTRQVSWTATTDSDSAIFELPDSFLAQHVGGYNTIALGVEMATIAALWPSMPDDHKTAILDTTAQVVALWCQRYGIPARRLTKAQVDAGQKGIVAHGDLSSQRTDPGAAFPWSDFLERVSYYLTGTLFAIGDSGEQVRGIQQFMTAQGITGVGTADGDAGPLFDSAVRSWQATQAKARTGIFWVAPAPSTPEPTPEAPVLVAVPDATSTPAVPDLAQLPRTIELQPGESVLIRCAA